MGRYLAADLKKKQHGTGDLWCWWPQTRVPEGIFVSPTDLATDVWSKGEAHFLAQCGTLYLKMNTFLPLNQADNETVKGLKLQLEFF